MKVRGCGQDWAEVKILNGNLDRQGITENRAREKGIDLYIAKVLDLYIANLV